MDNSNVRNLRELEPIDSTANIELLGNYDPEHQGIIRDPYFVRNYLKIVLFFDITFQLLHIGQWH